jgi:hypothetical protein
LIVDADGDLVDLSVGAEGDLVDLSVGAEGDLVDLRVGDLVDLMVEVERTRRALTEANLPASSDARTREDELRLMRKAKRS